jgi:hypothetical protein
MDPVFFVIDLQDAKKKLILKVRSQNESQISRNQGFFYFICMMIEGSGCLPLTNGSGSGSRRPKNIRGSDGSGSDPQHWLEAVFRGSESGSISQRHGSADPDPDPHQNVMDPQHWLEGDLFYGPVADLDLEAAEDEYCPGDGGDGPPDGRRQAREVQDDEHHGAGRGGSQALPINQCIRLFLPVPMCLPEHKCPINQFINLLLPVPMCLPEHKCPTDQSIDKTVCNGPGRGGSQALNTQVSCQSINLLNCLYQYLYVFLNISVLPINTFIRLFVPVTM